MLSCSDIFCATPLFGFSWLPSMCVTCTPFWKILKSLVSVAAEEAPDNVDAEADELLLVVAVADEELLPEPLAVAAFALLLLLLLAAARLRLRPADPAAVAEMAAAADTAAAAANAAAGVCVVDAEPASEAGDDGGESFIGCGVPDGVTLADSRLLLLFADVTGCWMVVVVVGAAGVGVPAADDDEDEAAAATAAAVGVCDS